MTGLLQDDWPGLVNYGMPNGLPRADDFSHLLSELHWEAEPETSSFKPYSCETIENLRIRVSCSTAATAPYASGLLTATEWCVPS